jgi:hypothetical protein
MLGIPTFKFEGKTGCCLHVNYEVQRFREGAKHTHRCLQAPAIPQVQDLYNLIHLQNVLNHESSRQQRIQGSYTLWSSGVM